MFDTAKFYIGFGMLILILVLGYTTKKLYDSNSKLASDLETANLTIANAKVNVQTQAKTAEFTTTTDFDYQTKITDLTNENTKLKSDIADGAKRLRPHATVSCTPTVTSTTDTGKSEAAVCRFTPTAERAWVDLDTGLTANRVQYETAMKTLNYWHDNWEALCGK